MSSSENQVGCGWSVLGDLEPPPKLWLLGNPGWVGRGGDCAYIPLALSYPIYHLLGVFSCFSCVQFLCNPIDCSLPSSSIHGIFPARILEWVAIPFYKGSSWPRDQTRYLLCLLHWQVGSSLLSHQGSPPLGQWMLCINSHGHITLLIVMLVHAK